MSEQKVFITRDGLKKLKIELDELKTVKRKEISAKIKEAISYGDLSENAEYDAAKNEQAYIEGRIAELEMQVANAEIYSEHTKKGTQKFVQIGSKVTVLQTAGKGEEVFTIVGSAESDPVVGKISNESPVGEALLEKRVGDVISVKTPMGVYKYTVKKIK